MSLAEMIGTADAAAEKQCFSLAGMIGTQQQMQQNQPCMSGQVIAAESVPSSSHALNRRNLPEPLE